MRELGNLLHIFQTLPSVMSISFKLIFSIDFPFRSNTTAKAFEAIKCGDAQRLMVSELSELLVSFKFHLPDKVV